MKLTSLLRLSLTTLLIANTVFAANPEPAKKADTILAHEKNFAFNWNNYLTVEPSKNKIQETEAYLKTLPDYSKLSAEDREILGLLFYKLGTYYTHIAHSPDQALVKLNIADTMLISTRDKAWNYNHLAYAYEEKFAASGKPADKEKALSYANKVINDVFSNMNVKEVAFAYYIKGLVQNDSKEYADAEINFKKSLAIYETIPDGINQQYSRVKDQLAFAVLNQGGRDERATTLLEGLKQYWSTKQDFEKNPYAADALVSLSQAYLKLGRAKSARNELANAVKIYTNVYGEHSEQLVRPYQLLATACEKLKDKNQAEIYTQKVKELTEKKPTTQSS